MKKLFTLFSFLIIVTINNGQVLRGKVSNVSDNKIYLSYSYDNLIPVTDTISLDAGGAFEKKFRNKTLLNVNFRANRAAYKFTISPRSDISFTADATSGKTLWNTISINGRGKELNDEHFINKYLSENHIGWDYNTPKDTFASSVYQWKSCRDSLRKKYVRKLNNNKLSKEDKGFLYSDSINDTYWATNALYDYYRNNRHPDSNFYRKNVAPYMIYTDDDSYLSSDSYINFMHDIISDRVRHETKVANSRYFKYVLQKLNDIPNEKLSKSLLSRSLYGDVLSFYYEPQSANNWPFYDSLIDEFGKKINGAVLQDLQQKATVIKEAQSKYVALVKGNKAPDFSLADSSNKTYTLKDFAGKVVYIDVWASWCGPCLAEIPSLKKLEERYKDCSDIVFVSISIDDTKSDWVRKGITAHHLTGLQLWAGKGGWTSKFATDYNLQGIPRFIILDKNGTIINIDAKRPSNNGIENDLNEALKM